ncbi:MAG: transporter [Bacteroidetes bacterium]|nr:transporter [Bacteroidota bacterium]
MKKTLFILIISLSISAAHACDICGCGGSNIYMGMLPDFKTKFIGIRYHYMQYYTQLATDQTQFSHNYYNTVEAWTGWNIGRKWQVLAFVPYYYNKQMDDDGASSKSGLGDITILANYQLLHTRTTSEHNNSVEQSLWIGAGVKLPTGTFKLDVTDPATTIADINAQIGTGSTDFLLNAMHHFRVNQFGVNTSANYKINTKNRSDYKYGNKFTGTSIAYYRIRVGGIAIAPNAGVIYEHTEQNTFDKASVQFTGGYAVSGLAGVEFTFNKIAIGFNVQKAFSQHYAGGQTKMEFRSMAHVTLAL